MFQFDRGIQGSRSGQLHLETMRQLAQEDKGRVFDAVPDRPAIDDGSGD
jgi:hypothetical protein